MTKRNKEKVYEAYEEIVEWFDDARTKTLMESEYLNLIINSVSAGSSVLDLGCGTGEPIAQFFIDKGFKVTGVDGSFLFIMNLIMPLAVSVPIRIAGMLILRVFCYKGNVTSSICG